MHISHHLRVAAPSLLEFERPAWIAAIATWVVGDLVTTFVGLSLGAGETNPLAAPLIGGFGPWVLLPLQLVALLVFVLAWVVLRDRDVESRVGIPIGISIVGVLIVANNLAVIYVLLSA